MKENLNRWLDQENRVENLMRGSLEIQVRKEGHRLVMNWLGQSDAKNSSSILNPYLSEILLDIGDAELMILFKELEYMNSSTVPAIVRFLKKLDSKKIKTTIVYNKDAKWQRVAFKALEALSQALDYITVKGT